MGHPLLSCISGGDGGGAFDGDQLGPDQMPVIGAKVPAADCAGGGLLNGDAVLRAGFSPGISVLPLTNLCIAQTADALPKLSHRQRARLCEVLVQVHNPLFCSICYRLAIAFARVAPATVKP